MKIENEYLKVEVTLNGGSLTSIFNKKTNREMLYQKDERSWMGQDVVIFPIIARLKDQECIVDNNVYKMKTHGLIRYAVLDIIDHKDNEITLGYKYNEETLQHYPFKFNFEVRYVLNDNSLMIEYRVYNLDDKDMYFNVGGHPALIVDGYETETKFVYDDVKLLFNEEYEVDQFFLDETGSLISHNDLVLLPKEFEMTKDIIEEAKTLIYDVTDINDVTLVSKDKKIVFDISKCNVLAIWTNPGFGNYICIEPWWGMPDFIDTNKVLSDKQLIQFLKPNDKYITDYKIKF
jgi:galactose mutarotase-like enzyme